MFCACEGEMGDCDCPAPGLEAAGGGILRPMGRERPFDGGRRASTTLRTITVVMVSVMWKGGLKEGDRQAKVSSIFTISRALVSINPQPLALAHSRPCRELTTLASFRSHLFPATILTGIARKAPSG